MLPLRYTKRWQFAGIAVLLIVLAFALTPTVWFQWKVPNPTDLPTDKWLHGLTFTFLTVWFSGQYSERAYWRLVLGMLAFGALIELCQRMLSYRNADSIDLLADSIGIGAGVIIAIAGAGGWSLRIEKWLLARA